MNLNAQISIAMLGFFCVAVEVCDSGERLLISELSSQSNYTPPLRAPAATVRAGLRKRTLAAGSLVQREAH